MVMLGFEALSSAASRLGACIGIRNWQGCCNSQGSADVSSLHAMCARSREAAGLQLQNFGTSAVMRLVGVGVCVQAKAVLATMLVAVRAVCLRQA